MERRFELDNIYLTDSISELLDELSKYSLDFRFEAALRTADTILGNHFQKIEKYISEQGSLKQPNCHASLGFNSEEGFFSMYVDILFDDTENIVKSNIEKMEVAKFDIELKERLFQEIPEAKKCLRLYCRWGKDGFFLGIFSVTCLSDCVSEKKKDRDSSDSRSRCANPCCFSSAAWNNRYCYGCASQAEHIERVKEAQRDNNRLAWLVTQIK